MMNQLIEFSFNHWEMVAVFLALLITLVIVESKSGTQSLTTASATNLINSEDAIVVDIRTDKEFKTGHMTGALNVPANKLEEHMHRLEKHKDTPIIVACKSGIHSGATAKTLKKKGFEKVYKLQGGIAEWQSSNLPLVKG